MISIPNFAWYNEKLMQRLGSSTRTNWLKTTKLMWLKAFTVAATSPLSARRFFIGIPKCQVMPKKNKPKSSEHISEIDPKRPKPDVGLFFWWCKCKWSSKAWVGVWSMVFAARCDPMSPGNLFLTNTDKHHANLKQSKFLLQDVNYIYIYIHQSGAISISIKPFISQQT